MSMRTVLVACAAVLLCGSSASAAVKPPSLVKACGPGPGVAARPLWLTTADGVRLYAVEAGASRTVAVLAHQGGSDLCQELPYAKALIASGLRILAFDFRGNGQSHQSAKHALALGSDLAAAVARAHEEKAKHVFLIGASMGGAAVVQNSAGLQVTGLVSLSGTRLWPGYGINKPGPEALRAPLLYLGSKSDWRAPLREARSIVRRVGSRDKSAVYYSGSLHGWELVQDAPFAAKARALILAWLRAHS
jgi:alpha-beta hydrolase superfamily lysophospholipase